MTGRAIALIESGKMKVVEGHLKTIHKIEINKLQQTIESIDVNVTLGNNFELENLLEIEKTKLKNNLRRITPKIRTRRGIEWIGSAIKWATGVPDADDLRYVEGKLDTFSINNNLQIKINTDFSTKINELTEAVNKLSHGSPGSDHDINLITTLLNMRSISDRIEAIQDAITLAKQDIASHKLLTMEEINYMAKLLENQGINLHMAEQALDFVSTTIGTNHTTILYIVTLPILRKRFYELLRFY